MTAYPNMVIQGLINELRERQEGNAEVMRILASSSLACYEERDHIDDMFEALIVRAEEFLEEEE